MSPGLQRSSPGIFFNYIARWTTGCPVGLPSTQPGKKYMVVRIQIQKKQRIRQPGASNQFQTQCLN